MTLRMLVATEAAMIDKLTWEVGELRARVDMNSRRIIAGGCMTGASTIRGKPAVGNGPTVICVKRAATLVSR